MTDAEAVIWADAFVKQVYDRADEAGRLLCELAQIPPICRKDFLKWMTKIFWDTYVSDSINLRRNKAVPPEVVAAYERFERALRETYSIFASIPRLPFSVPPLYRPGQGQAGD